ncbi:MAG TPA: DNA-processing protein DprA [Spongiibacteraceae bacterium]|nr:DNA-processing protein DprA [Spongiibacteraceae bacterium]
MTTSQTFLWLLLQHLPGFTANTIRKLALGDAAVIDPEAWLSWPEARLRAAGLSEQACASVIDWRHRPATCPAALAARRDQDWLAANAVQLLPLNHPHYPPLLLEISDPPPLLFVAGDTACLSLPQLAVVGSRRPSLQGLADAAGFAASLAQAGFVVTSGMAYGIDAAAHKAVLEVGGKTIAVLGCGIDRVYPPEHRQLATAIRASGALISDFPLGTPPRAAHFPSRNRIISGLSLGVLVVEAALRSGSLVTARLALEQNREVFAIPGSIHNPVSQGTNTLIRNGATLVQEADEIVGELVGWSNFAMRDRGSVKAELSRERAAATQITLTDAEAAVLDAIGFQPTPLDLIMVAATQPLPAVLAILGELELRGLVENRAGSYLRVVG